MLPEFVCDTRTVLDPFPYRSHRRQNSSLSGNRSQYLRTKCQEIELLLEDCHWKNCHQTNPRKSKIWPKVETFKLIIGYDCHQTRNRQSIFWSGLKKMSRLARETNLFSYCQSLDLVNSWEFWLLTSATFTILGLRFSHFMITILARRTRTYHTY